MKQILYHTDPDGFASGAIVLSALLIDNIPRDEIGLHPVNYGMDLPDIDYENDEVFLVDFSLQPYETMVEFAEKLEKRLTWIDHHQTSLDAEEKHPELKDVPGTRLVKLNSRKICGCELTWNHFFDIDDIPLFIELIGDWDTWRWKEIPDSVAPEYITFLNSADYDVKNSERWWLSMINSELDEPGSTEKDVESMVGKGKLLLEYQRFQDKKKMEAHSFEAKFDVYRAILINGSGNTEAFNGFYDPDRHDLMVNFQLSKDGYWTIGLFTDKTDKIHCGRLAEELGHAGPIPSGGGHDGAAGFQTTWEYFNSLLDPEVG